MVCINMIELSELPPAVGGDIKQTLKPLSIETDATRLYVDHEPLLLLLADLACFQKVGRKG